jgi:hypothetical protein
MDLLQASWSSPFDESKPNPLSVPRIGMTNWAALAVPSVGGSRIEFRVPRKLPERRGTMSATTPPAFRLTATTTCSEHPLTFDYRIVDAGREIQIDGDVSDWSGGPYAQDGVGELHPVLPHLDLKSVWCEHGPDQMYVRADFAAPGFGKIPSGDGDVTVWDALFIEIEPVGAAYMDPVLLRVPATSPAGEPANWGPSASASDAPRPAGPATARARYACGTATVEVAIPRRPEQTHLRVSVWTDAVRVDEMTGPWQPLPR